MQGLIPTDGLAHRDAALQGRRELLAVLEDKLIPEASGSRPLLLLVAGGTNSGKSTLVNLLVGREVSAVSALAGATRRPLAVGPESVLAEMARGPQGWLLERTEDPRAPLGEGVSSRALLTAVVEDRLPGVVVVDSPDLDTDYRANRDWAERLLRMCDVVLLVVTPEKYHDAAGIEFLERARSTGRTVVGVFNKADGSDPAAQDFRRAVLRPEEPLLRIPRGAVGSGESLRGELGAILADPLGRKAASLEGSRRRAAGLAGDLIRRGEEELRSARGLEAWSATRVEEASERYQGFLRAHSRFAELDRLVAAVLRRFDVPILDPLYRRLLHWPRRLMAQAASRIRPGTVGAAALEVERQTEELRLLGRELARTLRRGGPDLPPLVLPAFRSWAEAVPEGLEESSLELHQERVARELEGWLDREAEHLFARLEQRTGLVQGLRVGRLILQVGSGAAAAVLTGGLGPTDAILAPAVERLLARITRGVGGRVYFRRLQRDLLQLHRRLARELLAHELAAPLLERFPGPDPEALEQLRRVT